MRDNVAMQVHRASTGMCLSFEITTWVILQFLALVFYHPWVRLIDTALRHSASFKKKCASRGLTLETSTMFFPIGELPEELVATKILTRVPLEDILRCKRVCKRWLATIKGRSFTSAWRKQQAKRPWLLVLRRWCKEWNEAAYADYRDHQIWYHNDDTVRVPFDFPPFYVLGCCPEGLACVSVMGGDLKQLAICNIATRKLKKLPRLDVLPECLSIYEAKVVVCEEDMSYKVAVPIQQERDYFLGNCYYIERIAVYDSKVQHWEIIIGSPALEAPPQGPIMECSFEALLYDDGLLYYCYTWGQHVLSCFKVPCAGAGMVSRSIFRFRGRTMVGFVEWIEDELPLSFVIQELLCTQGDDGTPLWSWKRVSTINIAAVYGKEWLAYVRQTGDPPGDVECLPYFTVADNCVIISGGHIPEEISIMDYHTTAPLDHGLWPPLCYNMDDGSCRIMIRHPPLGPPFNWGYRVLATFTPHIGLLEDAIEVKEPPDFPTAPKKRRTRYNKL